MNILNMNQKTTICSFCNRCTSWVINISGPCRELTQRQPLCSWDCAASLAAELLNKRHIKRDVYDNIYQLCSDNLPVITMIQRPEPRAKPAGKVIGVAQWNKQGRQTESVPQPGKKKPAKSGPAVAKALVEANLVQSAVIFPSSQHMEPMIQAPFRVTDWQDMVLQTQRLRRIQLISVAGQPPFILIDDGSGNAADINQRATQQLRALLSNEQVTLYGNVLQMAYEGKDTFSAASISQ